MSRPRIPIGTFGEITFINRPNKRIEARTRYRDWDGQTRIIQVTSSSRPAAEIALKQKLAERNAFQPVDTTLTPDSPFPALVDYWLADLDLEKLSRVVVIDATNPWLETDGQDPPPSPLRGHPEIRLVRSLSHLPYEDLGAYAAPAGAPFRTAVAVASDDTAARSQVAALVDDLGFDPVEMEARNAWLADTTGPFFGRRLSSAEMSAIASASRRANRLTW